MGRKEPGLLKQFLAVVLVVYGIIDGLNGFQSTMQLVDRLLSLGKGLPSPYGDYVVIAALYIFLRRVNELRKLG